MSKKKKIISKFAQKCPTCTRALYVHEGSRVDQPWSCAACATTLCAMCYATHTAEAHPNMNVIFTTSKGVSS